MISTIILQHIEEFACRGTVKITYKFYAQGIIVSLDRDFEIFCHRDTPFARLSISENERHVFSPDY